MALDHFGTFALAMGITLAIVILASLGYTLAASLIVFVAILLAMIVEEI